MQRLTNWDSFVNVKTLFHQLLIDMPYMHGDGGGKTDRPIVCVARTKLSVIKNCPESPVPVLPTVMTLIGRQPWWR